MNDAFYYQKSTDFERFNSRTNVLKKIPYGNLTAFEIQGFQKLLKEGDKNNFIQGKVEVLLSLSLAHYYSKRNFDQIIFQTEEIGKIASEHDDYFSKSIAKKIRGGVFLDLSLIDEGKKELEETQNLIEKISESDFKLLALNYYSKIYSEYFFGRNEYDKVVSISKKRQSDLLTLNDFSAEKKYLLIETYNVVCSTYLKMGYYKSVEKYLKVQEAYFQNIKDLYNLANFQNNQAELASKTLSRIEESNQLLNRYKRAEHTALLCDNSAVLINVYSKITALYKSEKDLENQIKYLNKTIQLNSDLDKRKQEMLNKIGAMIKPHQSNQLLHYIIAGLLIVVIIWFFTYFIKNKKELDENIDYYKTVSESQLLDIALHNNNSFYINFLIKFPDFNGKILALNSTMKNTDLEFIALIKTGLSDEQIAEVKRISLKAVKSKKYRIRKKLNLSDDKNISIWLENL